MGISTREMVITYGSYSCGGSSASRIDGYTAVLQGTVQTGVRFDILLTADTVAAMAAACIAIEAAFRTPYKNLTVVIAGETFLTLSHTSGTGFNANPSIEKSGQVGDSALSRVYSVRIDFGMPADTYDSSYRRESQVRIVWSPDRRMHVSVDGTYTVNGSTSARAQYLAAIGAYASSILTALGGTFDLLEEHVENDDQNKVATFHRLYDEQFSGRNEATIAVFYSPDRRKHVTISGKFTKVSTGSGARAAYEAAIAGFASTVLAAIGGTYDLQAENADANDADTVLTFSRTYDELVGGRKEASYSIAYDGARIRTVTFQGTYSTVSTGASARSTALSDAPTWAATILSALSVTASDKVSETVTPNDQDNAATFQIVYRELIYSEAGALPDTQIVSQRFTIKRVKEAPGDSPTATRVVTLDVDYSALIVWTLNTNLQAKWTAIRNWLVATILPTYQAGTIAVVKENVGFDPVSNEIFATMSVDVAVGNILLNKLEIADDVDQGKEFVGVWDDNPLDFFKFDGHITAIRTITKTYRRLRGTAVPGAGDVTYSGPTPAGAGGTGNLLKPPSIPISGDNGEAGDDPYGFGGFNSDVIKRSQTKAKLDIGLPPNQMFVEDIVFVTVIRVTSSPPESSGPTQ